MDSQDGSTGKAIIKDNLGRDKIVTFVVIGDLAIVEGDILIGRVDDIRRVPDDWHAPVSSRSSARNPLGAPLAGSGPPPQIGLVMDWAMGESHRRWPRIVGSGTLSESVPLVPYEIDPNLPRPDRVQQAMTQWTFRTSIEFHPRFNEPDWVYFTPGPSDAGGYSHIGMKGGRQEIRLADDSEFGIVMHEIGHAIGLWHEQSRSDRDRYITINRDNIVEKFKSAFDHHPAEFADEIGPYDYSSIMHYPRKAFSINGGETIIPTDPNAVIGQRRDLSDGDIAAVRALYPTQRIHNPTPRNPPRYHDHPYNPR